jgi:CRISPR system Cascade subunit CasA
MDSMSDDASVGFSLIDEPWILVRFHDGDVREVSLREVFRDAAEIVGIVGEIPTQTFAITRLLLAILYASQRPVKEPDAVWQLLWASDDPLLVVVEGYLERHRDRFDLLHPAQPFYQVADLSTTSGETSALDKLIADVPNGEPFFTTRLKSGIDRITFAEAARWLIHCQAFDPSGIKSGAVGDNRAKGGKGYPIGTAWAGSLGGLLIEGKNLRETLLLNFTLGDGNGEPFAASDLPVWERGALGPGEEGRGVPQGPADLYTWPSRRIRLAHDNYEVLGVVISNGDPLKAQLVQGIHNLEPMTAWRRSETQEKTLKSDGRHIYMPLTHRPERSMWRGLSALLPQSIREQQYKNGSKYLPALTFGWVGKMSDGGTLPRKFLLTRAIGMEYGSQSATVAEIVDDSLTMDSILLGQEGKHLVDLAISAVEQTDLAVFQLGALARNLAIAKGGEPDGPGDRLREQAYFALDAPFRTWLSRLGQAKDVLAAREDWYSVARSELLVLANQAVEASGPSAWVGRISSRTGKPVNSPEAFGWFIRELYRALPDGKKKENPTTDENKVEAIL